MMYLPQMVDCASVMHVIGVCALLRSPGIEEVGVRGVKKKGKTRSYPCILCVSTSCGLRHAAQRLKSPPAGDRIRLCTHFLGVK